MTKKNTDIPILAGQLVAQNMMIQMLLGHLVQHAPDKGAGVREALVQGSRAIASNPNMTQAEKFGAVRTLDDALDTMDRVRAALGR